MTHSGASIYILFYQTYESRKPVYSCSRLSCIRSSLVLTWPNGDIQQLFKRLIHDQRRINTRVLILVTRDLGVSDNCCTATIQFNINTSNCLYWSYYDKTIIALLAPADMPDWAYIRRIHVNTVCTYSIKYPSHARRP